METHYAIRAKNGGKPLAYEDWCALVREQPGFVRAEPRSAVNPFTRQPCLVYPRNDSGPVIVNGQIRGRMFWSQSGTNEAIISGDTDVVGPLAFELAAVLGCEAAELRE